LSFLYYIISEENSMAEIKIAVVGGGNMGSAIIGGVIGQGFSPGSLLLIEPSLPVRKKLEKEFKISTSEKLEAVVKKCSVVIIAVKPNVVKEILLNLSPHLSKDHLIISVAAGISIRYIERHFKYEVSVVRTMPNIAARVGKAAVALCCNSVVTKTQLETALSIMKCIGTVIEVDERQMDAVTGLSGSGPAFVFQMIESLADGGVLMGIPREKALDLAVLTVLGSASYLKELNMHPTLAKESVTTPGGTTIEGLMKLEECGFNGLVMNAVKSASEKSRAIGLKLNE
jgi:pyrroline-5-carboxylate reductase